jgi:hypothetical protein
MAKNIDEPAVLTPQFVLNAKGKVISVLLPLAAYEQLMVAAGFVPVSGDPTSKVASKTQDKSASKKVDKKEDKKVDKKGGKKALKAAKLAPPSDEAAGLILLDQPKDSKKKKKAGKLPKA